MKYRLCRTSTLFERQVRPGALSDSIRRVLYRLSIMEKIWHRSVREPEKIIDTTHDNICLASTRLR